MSVENKYCRFKIKVDRANGKYNREILEKTLIENQSNFHDLFYRLIDMGDAAQNITDDSLSIEDIDYDDNGGIADVTFDWNIFRSCVDMNEDGSFECSLKFKLINGYICFDIELPAAWKPM